MVERLPLEIAGERVELLGDRALYWPSRNRLLIADLHLGKADTFRHSGIALPRGGTDLDLERISVLLKATGADSLWVLGDMLHSGLTDTHWRSAWADWRMRHANTEIVAIIGNHDRSIRAARLEIRLSGHEVDDPPFLLRHEPRACATRHVLSGHVHPAITLPGLPRRWPAFWLRADITVLPAFSAFTGGVVVPAIPGESLVACIEGQLMSVPTRPFR